ncbi:uncharacterized protein N7482_001711 [Penicillium canariense]|uniref:Altered inheritance of mitochondria protein 6 n=1 Tax=Penicillium canariense TaxID=189055 RepID=A0A9W9LU60_9EURO|nr:uncharacterized protein N7482_001711 [Penicillium canariense]KAJ5175834.1 hypothetical protein N7482_001711 [Penicillium canariense]
MGAPEILVVPPKEELDYRPATVRYEYDPWLLDDHPLRSHPTECIPGLGTFLAECCVSFQRRWRDYSLRVGYLLLACLAAFQCLKLLPFPAGQGLPRLPVTSRISPRDWHVKCTYPHSDPRPNTLAQSVAAGCDGFRTDIWLRGNALQIGPSHLGPNSANDLPLHFDPIIAKLEADHAPSSLQIPLTASADGLNERDPTRTFMLVLNAQSSLHELLPFLVSHLDVLRHQGHLTHWDGARVIQRAVTVVVTGESVSNLDHWTAAYSDVFWSAEPGLILAEDLVNGQLLPIGAV